MGRAAKPWYRSGRGWYVEHGGRQVCLASGPRDETEEAARVAFHRVKAGLPIEEGSEGGPTVGELIGQFLRHVKAERKPSTFGWYRATLRGFRDKHQHRLAAAIVPHDLLEWARAFKSANYRRNNLAAVKAAFAWGETVGLLTTNPVSKTPKPAPRRRQAIPTADAVARFLDATAGTPLGDLARVLWDTGCRLQDARRLEARLVRWDAGVAVLPEHKTDGTTGKPKVVAIPAGTLELLKRLAERWPEGALLRNTRDQAWTQSAVSQAFQAARIPLGMGPEMTPHGLRHRWVTDAAKVLPRPVVAALAGHGVEMTDRIYDHTDDEILSDAAAMVAAAELVRGRTHSRHPPPGPSATRPPDAAPAPSPSAHTGSRPTSRRSRPRR